MQARGGAEGFTPVPVREMECAVPGWLSELVVMVAVPVKGPASVGLKVMGIAQLKPAPRLGVLAQ